MRLVGWGLVILNVVAAAVALYVSILGPASPGSVAELVSNLRAVLQQVSASLDSRNLAGIALVAISGLLANLRDLVQLLAGILLLSAVGIAYLLLDQARSKESS